MALTIGELYEGLEAHRKGSIFDHKSRDICRMVSDVMEAKVLPSDPNMTLAELQKITYEQYVRGTVEEEIADCTIRLLDYCGGFNITFKDVIVIQSWPDNFGQGILILNKELLQAEHVHTRGYSAQEEINEAYSFAARKIISFCMFHGIDLSTHIQWKLDYNATRERMHGGNRY